MGRDGRGAGGNRLCDGWWLCCKVMREKVGLEAGSFHKENLRQAERRDGAILSAKVIRTIEELLTKLLIVQGRGSSPLYWRVKKDRIFMDGDIVSLKFSPADLALLCDGR